MSTPGHVHQRRSLWELKRDEETSHDIFIEYLGENQPPSEWEKRYDTYTQKIYYANKRTRMTQWENPLDKSCLESL